FVGLDGDHHVDRSLQHAYRATTHPGAGAPAHSMALEWILYRELGEQGEVAIAAQQLLDPMSYADRGDSRIVNHRSPDPSSSCKPCKDSSKPLRFRKDAKAGGRE